MSQTPVFYDPQGGRKRVLSVGMTALIVGLCLLATLFALSVFYGPAITVANPKTHRRTFLPTPANKLTDRAATLAARDQVKLATQINLGKHPSRPLPPPGSPICAAFYAPWQENGIHSLTANSARISHVIPQWVHLTTDGKGLDFTTDFDPNITPQNTDVIRIANEGGMKIIPILDDGYQGDFVGAHAHAMLNDPVVQGQIINQTRDWLTENHFNGINLDLEALSSEDDAKVPACVAAFARALHPEGLVVTADIEADADLDTVKQIGAAADWIVVMDYDEHSEDGEVGPIAGLDWSEQQIKRIANVVPRDKVVMGIGNYAYDWTSGHTPAESLTYQEAITLARDNYEDQKDVKTEDIIDFDPDSLNSNFDYVDDAGKEHTVWMLDAVSAFNSFKLNQNLGTRGVALWVLGSEDPGVWTFLGRDSMRSPALPAALETVEFPFDVDNEGDGEILRVKELPVTGSRTVQVDPTTGLIVDFAYQKFPSSYVIQRSGFKKESLALTFDDGPDETYTPQILEALKELNVPATFFVIGTNAEKYPALVAREFDYGNEIGNHSFTHPNLGETPPERVALELNATQRAIQSITGRSTTLFRPPYFADAEPSNPDEVKPVTEAWSMGYTTIGEFIDPEDWQLEAQAADGSIRKRTAADFTEEVLGGVNKGTGNVILLHDAGGDRSETVKALKQFVPILESKGYKFVLVSDLMGETRDQVMPKVSAADLYKLQVDRTAFWLWYGAEALLAVCFMAAIALGLGRVVLATSLALLYERSERRIAYPTPTASVAVLIAAYNEEKTISRTVQSVLASEYAPTEVIVVDDGSRDGTSAVVQSEFADDPRVRCVRQENGGKASALNTAIELATAEILVCVDADTQISPDAISLLVRHFDSPEIGAVAGNVRVGNTVNLLTVWQSLEYTTAQNVDRRAYALLNAITVVPGAIGAWRRDAVIKAGGYLTDTLAEDMDLTWRLRELGYRQETESGAVAFTEAPDNIKSFFKQRFRWAYGTLQCLWKHKSSVGHYRWFGCFALPSLWLFQVVFNALAPFVDLQLLYSLFTYFNLWLNSLNHNDEFQPLSSAGSSLKQVAFLYLLFFFVEAFAGVIAYRMEKRSPKAVVWLFFQRFVYRQLMYAVIYKSIVTALAGARQGWGKIDRKATVRLPLADTLRKSHDRPIIEGKTREQR